MTKGKMRINIVTPEKTVFNGEVRQATMPTRAGEITILPDHIPYIGEIKPGEVLVKDEKEHTSIAVSGGFLEFRNNILTVLADTAERAEDIDLERAEEARKRAEELKDSRKHMDDAEFAKVAALIEKEMTRVKVARKHHTRRKMNLG